MKTATSVDPRPSSPQVPGLLQAILVDRCGPAAALVQENQDLATALALDSLDRLDLVAVIEDAFDVRLPDEALQPPTSLTTLREAVCTELKKERRP